MDNTSDAIEMEIINDYDYSNAVIDIETLSYLVQYCDSCYNQFLNTCEEEEEKNKKLKSEFKYYNYKKGYNSIFEITIKKEENTFESLKYKSFQAFSELISSNGIKNVDSLVINMDLSYKCGKEFEMKEHNNLFKISFKPYDITFKRKSNFKDPVMDNIENNINELLKRFKTQNTIFCTK